MLCSMELTRRGGFAGVDGAVLALSSSSSIGGMVDELSVSGHNTREEFEV